MKPKTSYIDSLKFPIITESKNYSKDSFTNQDQSHPRIPENKQGMILLKFDIA